MVEITLLGPIQFLEDGQPIRGFRSVKAQALWAYLCLVENPVPRTTLVDLFWPSLDETRGRRNLSWVLSQLTKKLPGSLEADRHQVHYVHHPDVIVDVHRFQALIAQDTRSSLTSAADLYQGELLSGLFLDDCPEFESWLVGERELWRQRVIQTMTRLVNRLMHKRAYADGIAAGQALLRLDPWNEAVHQMLMRLFYYDGQKEAAAAQYRRLSAALEDELGVAPSPESKRLLEEILSDSLAEPSPLPAGPARKSGNVPASLGISIGRHREIAEIVERLSRPDCRLLTITGLGGVGKTHVALQAARQIAVAEADLFPDGVFTVDLTAASNTTHIILEIGRALDLVFSDTLIDLEIQLIVGLQENRRLLVLDNFEHLIDHSTFLVNLLRGCPGIKLMVTSRLPLRLPDEWVVQLEGLETREGVGDEDAEGSAQRLFLHRVRQQRDFDPSPDDREAIAAICQLVDGLPLGIELAAALVRLINPIDLYESLSVNFKPFLTGALNQETRDRSLNAVVAYSWSRLDAKQKEALVALSAFEGGFTREAASSVAAIPLQTLAVLKDNALIRLSAEPGRFMLHSIVRAFVQQQEGAGLAPLSVYEQAHAFYFGDWLHKRIQEFQGPRQRLVLQQMARDWENIRQSWQWAAGHATLAVPFFTKAHEAVFHFCDMRSQFSEGLVLFLAASRAIDPADTERDAVIVRNQLQARAGWFSFLLGSQIEGRNMLRASLGELEDIDDGAHTLFARNYLAAALRYLGQLDEAHLLVTQSLAWLNTPGNDAGTLPQTRHVLAITHNIISQIALDRGDYETAEEHGRLSLRYVRDIQNHWSMGFSLVNLGEVALVQNEIDRARRWFEESLAIRRETGDLRGTAVCLNLIGECFEQQGDLTAARDYYKRSSDLFRDIDNQWGVALTLKNLGRIALKKGELGQARDRFWRSLRRSLRMQAQGLMWETLVDLREYPFEEADTALAAAVGRLTERYAERTLAPAGAPERLRSFTPHLPNEGGRWAAPDASDELVTTVEELLRLFEI